VARRPQALQPQELRQGQELRPVQALPPRESVVSASLGGSHWAW
jgi:hypothetical protein